MGAVILSIDLFEVVRPDCATSLLLAPVLFDAYSIQTIRSTHAVSAIDRCDATEVRMTINSPSRTLITRAILSVLTHAGSRNGRRVSQNAIGKTPRSTLLTKVDGVTPRSSIKTFIEVLLYGRLTPCFKRVMWSIE